MPVGCSWKIHERSCRWRCTKKIKFFYLKNYRVAISVHEWPFYKIWSLQKFQLRSWSYGSCWKLLRKQGSKMDDIYLRECDTSKSTQQWRHMEYIRKVFEGFGDAWKVRFCRSDKWTDLFQEWAISRGEWRKIWESFSREIHGIAVKWYCSSWKTLQDNKVQHKNWRSICGRIWVLEQEDIRQRQGVKRVRDTC